MCLYDFLSSGVMVNRQVEAFCNEELNVCVKHAAVVTYRNLKVEKKWYQVDAIFDEKTKRPYLIVKYSEDSYNRIVMPVFSEESLSPDELHGVFNTLHPPGDPSSYEDGLIMALVSSDMSIVYHNICTDLVPPTEQPTSSIPRSRKLKKLARERKFEEKSDY